MDPCNSTTTDGVSDIADQINIMRYQEETTYRCRNYMDIIKMHASRNYVDEICRVKMCEWCYQVVDAHGFSRKCVSIGFSYLDRFLCTKSGYEVLANRELYQLATMTALYMAIKIHEPVKMDIKMLLDISHSAFSKDQVEAMERSIIFALEWKMTGPTSFEFISFFLALMPEYAPSKIMNSVEKYSRYLAELAVAESSFIDLMPSEIALAAVVNAISEVSVGDFSMEGRRTLLLSIENCTGLLISDIMGKVQSTLNLLMIGVSPLSVDQDTMAAIDHKIDGSYHHSPVSVAR